MARYEIYLSVESLDNDIAISMEISFTVTLQYSEQVAPSSKLLIYCKQFLLTC